MNAPIVNICALELNNPDPELFESTMGVPEGRIPSDKCPGTCWNCPFLTKCFSPSQRRCLVPKDCQVYELGREKSEDGDSITYFASKKGDRMVFFRLTEPVCRWADIRRIEEDEVPDWVISNFRTEIADRPH